MTLRFLLLCYLVLQIASNALGQQEDSSMSWLATGPASATYFPDSTSYSLPMTGTHSEIAFWQDRSVFTNFFDGLHLIQLELAGEGLGNSGESHAPKYSSTSLFYSLGYDLYLANFAHLQPYLAYGIGTVTFSNNYADSTGAATPYEEKSEWADWGIYGVNLILEITGKLWLGYALNFYQEQQAIEYQDADGSIELGSSQTLMLVWNWERVPIKAIDPRASFWGGRE